MSTIEEIRARWAAATPGPWGWRGNRDAQDITLSAHRSWFPIVMDFWRWGMRDARPIFRDRDRDVLYKPEFTRPPGHEHHPWLIDGIDHPDARFIAASWADVRDLLAEVDRLNDALAPLVAIPPIRYHKMKCYCHHCGAHLPNGNEGHEDDCPWVRACGLVAGEGGQEDR
jgi:hypothetical protein